MTGSRLADLRTALAEVYRELESAIAAGLDTTALEDRANVIQDEIDAILEVVGAEIYEQTRQRPRSDPPPPSSDRLF